MRKAKQTLIGMKNAAPRTAPTAHHQCDQPGTKFPEMERGAIVPSRSRQHDQRDYAKAGVIGMMPDVCELLHVESDGARDCQTCETVPTKPASQSALSSKQPNFLPNPISTASRLVNDWQTSHSANSDAAMMQLIPTVRLNSAAIDLSLAACRCR